MWKNNNPLPSSCPLVAQKNDYSEMKRSIIYLLTPLVSISCLTNHLIMSLSMHQSMVGTNCLAASTCPSSQSSGLILTLVFLVLWGLSLWSGGASMVERGLGRVGRGLGSMVSSTWKGGPVVEGQHPTLQHVCWWWEGVHR